MSEYGKRLLPVLAVTALVLMGIVLSLVLPFGELKTAPLNAEAYQATLFAFVIALAAYIGGIERDLIKKIHEYKHDNTKKDANKALDREADLRWLIGVDWLLMVLGLSFTAELILPKGLSLIDWIHEFKPVMLPLIMIYLAGLHVRQWKLKLKLGGTVH